MKHKRDLDLIMDALDEFGFKRCPECDSDILWADYHSQGDILRWLEEREKEEGNVKNC